MVSTEVRRETRFESVEYGKILRYVYDGIDERLYSAKISTLRFNLKTLHKNDNGPKDFNSNVANRIVFDENTKVYTPDYTCLDYKKIEKDVNKDGKKIFDANKNGVEGVYNPRFQYCEYTTNEVAFILVPCIYFLDETDDIVFFTTLNYGGIGDFKQSPKHYYLNEKGKASYSTSERNRKVLVPLDKTFGMILYVLSYLIHFVICVAGFFNFMFIDKDFLPFIPINNTVKLFIFYIPLALAFPLCYWLSTRLIFPSMLDAIRSFYLYDKPLYCEDKKHCHILMKKFGRTFYYNFPVWIVTVVGIFLTLIGFGVINF